MPGWWFKSSVKVIAPVLLFGLFCWNIYTLIKQGGRYNSDYAFWAEVLAGWVVSALVFMAGPIIKLIIHFKKKKGFVENEIVWEDKDEE